MIDFDKWKHEIWDIADMRPYEKNPRKITKEGLAQLKKSLENIGYVDDIALFKDGRIAGGHARYYVLKDQGVKSVSVKRCNVDLTDKEEREVVTRLNKNIAGEWDFEILENDFKLDELLDIGFTTEELDFKMEDEDNNGLTDEDDVPEIQEDPITKRGDVWLLGAYYECEKCKKEYSIEEGRDMKGCPCE